MNIVSVAAYLLGSQVDRKVVGDDDECCVSVGDSPQDGAQPCEKFVDGERLGDIVVGSRIEAATRFGLAVAGVTVGMVRPRCI